ncbi:MAG TPA: diguanylate cyclase [Bacilli bacterium]|nr:diguanylate cyclase [Bacilli bacterium]
MDDNISVAGLWSLFADVSDDHFWLMSDPLTYAQANKAHASYFSLSEKKFNCANVYDLFEATNCDLARIDYEAPFQGKTIVFERWYPNHHGMLRLLEITLKPIKDTDKKKVAYVAGFARDITDLKQKQNEMEYYSFHDFLTNLYNRRYFEQRIEELDQPQNYPLTVFMMDVNGLKLINDTYGHQTGDMALKRIASILTLIFKDHDIVARIGGDEFAVLLLRREEKEVASLKQQLLTMIEDAKIVNINLSLAVGYEQKRHSDIAIQEIMRHAENSMYRHKLTNGQKARNDGVRAILKTLFERDRYERRHSAKVAEYSYLLGKAMGLHEDELVRLRLAGTYFDIGKVSIAQVLLNKKGKLNDDECHVIKTHVENGYQILKAADHFSDIAIHALYHHERYDGKGYPNGLKGSEIPLCSRIISIADTYHALRSKRPYRDSVYSKENAASIIASDANKLFDPELVKQFIETVLPNID